MAKPGRICGAHLCVLLLVQVLLCFTPSVTGLDIGDACNGTDDTTCIAGTACVEVSQGSHQCRLNIGETCTDTVNCTINAECMDVDGSSSECRLNVGENCTDTINCTVNAECVDVGGSSSECRLNVGETCTDTVNCAVNTECAVVDGSSSECRLNVGETCTGANNCTNNAECVDVGDSNRECRLKVGQTCIGTINCTNNAECVDVGGSDFECRLPVGKTCTANSECSTNKCAEVENSGHQCRIAVGDKCTKDATDECQPGAECSEALCKIKVGESCTGPSNDQCTDGTECVNTGSEGSPSYQCRITAGSSVNCGFDNDCVTTAVCESNICKIKVGETCAASNDHCKNGTECLNTGTGDSPVYQCQIKVGENCTGPSTDDCKNGTQCVNTGTDGSPVYQCRITAGSSVNCGTADDCVTTAVCESNTCKIKVGQTCTASSDHCKNGTQCVNTVTGTGSSPVYQCRITGGSSVNCGTDDDCVTTAECESDTCKIKVGETCTASSDHCKNGTQCVNTGSDGSPGYQCRKNYGVECNDTIECQTSQGQECVGLTSGTNLCLCDDQSFRHESQCQNVTLLKAIDLQMSGTDHQESSISVKWTRAAAIPAEYQAALSNGQASNFSTNLDAFNFTDDLTQGSAYTFTVTTRTLRNPSYRNVETYDEYTSVVSDPADVYTKPAQPGDLVRVMLPGPNVTVEFTASQGLVDDYRVTVTHRDGEEGGPHSPQGPVRVVGNLVSADFVGLVPGEYYVVSIVATSNGIDSEETTGTFRVQAQPAGPVANLTLTAQGSRWAHLNWFKPVNPNGVISGYTVKLTLTGDTTSCFSGVTVDCSDCSYNSSEVIPDTSSCGHSTTMTLTQNQLNDVSFVVEVNVTGLLPDVWYQVDAAAYNEEGPGDRDTHLNLTTDSEAAANLVTMSVTAPATGQLLVSWTPGERRGETSYIVTWEKRVSLTSEGFARVDSILLHGYSENQRSIPDLLSYWDYRVTVSTNTTVGPAPDSNTTVRRTLESEPGKVQSLDLQPSGDDATKVTMTFGCPLEEERNGHLVKFHYNSTVINTQAEGPAQRPEGTVLVSGNDCSSSFSEVLSVTAETNYEVVVYAETEGGKIGEERNFNVYVAARAPIVLDRPAPELMTEGKKTETSVAVTIETDVCSDSQGRVEAAGLLCCRKTAQESCQRGSTANKQSSHYTDTNLTPTWNKYKKGGRKGFYKCTPNDWLTVCSGGAGRRKRSILAVDRVRRDTGTFPYIIGSNTTCSDLPDDVYCNGPLDAGEEYHVYVFSCTSGGCSETTGPIVLKTVPEDEFPIAAVIGAVAAVVVITIIVVAAVIVYRRRRHLTKKEDESFDHMEEPTEIRVVRKPVKLGEFAAHLETLHKDSNLQFQAEFEDITEKSPAFAQTAAVWDTNKVKNRYSNILPFDYTRVKLLTDEDDPTSDYINASYIPGYSSQREYIATQGPMTGTVNDFWRMIWEQNSCLIVQLSDLTEKGRPKVDLYWPQDPNTPMQYGDIIVTMTSMSTLNKYTIRNFTICMENRMEDKRQVVQYFIHGWVDFSANLNPEDVLEFIRTVRLDARRNASRPITVHCSAGVGRTGTFIALDFLQQFVDDHTLHDEVDIYNLVLNMRHHRPLMVQSESQYVFIHDTLKLIVERKIQSMKSEEENIYQNTVVDENIYANQGFEMEENIYQNTGFGGADPTTAL